MPCKFLNRWKVSMDNLFSHLDTANPKDSRRPPSGGWLILGPGGGGCVHTLTVNPHRPDTLVVSCDMTAGYITHNGGKSWREFNLKSRQYAYAFDPHDTDTLWVGTSGLFRSRDNGGTWQLIFPDPARLKGETRLGDECRHSFLPGDNWPGKNIHAITVDPSRQGQLFIGIKKMGPPEPFDFQKPVKREGILIYTTRDDGVTWREIAELSASDIYLVVLDPASPVEARTLYVFTEKAVFRVETVNGQTSTLSLPENVRYLNHAASAFDPETGDMVFYLELPGPQAGSTLLRSRDLGQSWDNLARVIASLAPAGPPWITQVSACAADARSVWAILEHFPDREADGTPVDRYGILHSIDAGQTWNWVVEHDDFHDPDNREFGWAERDYGAKWGDLTGDHHISPKGSFAWDVVASPVDPDTCYTMDFSTIYTTRNGGQTWQQLVTNLHPDGSASSRGIDVLSVYGVVFDPFDSQHIVLPVTDAGIFHSLNSGRTWQHDLQGVPREWINTCYWMVFDPQVKGRAWSAWSAMHDLPRLKMFREEFFARDRGGICKSEDGLQSWMPSASGLPEHALCTHLVLDPTSPAGQRTLYAAVFNRGVYKSIDDGASWMPRNKGLDPRNLFAWRLALLPDGTLYLVTVKNRLPGHEYTGAVYRSTDGAETWELLPLPDGVDFPNDLTFDLSGRLYLACWPYLEDNVNRGGGAYASDDGGRTWVSIFDPGMHVYTVSVDFADPSILYIGTFDAALFRSTDRGGTWKQMDGFDFQWGHRPIPDPHHPGMLYMTTFGSSVWYGPAHGAENTQQDGLG
jgi:photosystem II stability/assembly factor-like uncharacterized protein